MSHLGKSAACKNKILQFTNNKLLIKMDLPLIYTHTVVMVMMMMIIIIIITTTDSNKT